MIGRDPDETFLSYSYDEERSKVLYSSYKHPLLNIFQGTAFQRHAKMLIEERSAEDISQLFFLSSTTDCKEFFGNVHLHPIDCSYEDFSNYSVKSNIHNILPTTS